MSTIKRIHQYMKYGDCYGCTGDILALLDLVEEMAGALNEIATSKHQAYTDGPYISEHDSGYKMGVADGHRYCANIAGKAIAAYEKMKGE